LLHKAFENKKSVYFFVARKSEAMLCAEYVELIKTNLNIPILVNLLLSKAYLIY
jgi:hypothetical protein